LRFFATRVSLEAQVPNCLPLFVIIFSRKEEVKIEWWSNWRHLRWSTMHLTIFSICFNKFDAHVSELKFFSDRFVCRIL
jgi:hypothetical protein